MKRLACEMCGSMDVVKQEGVFVCQACGCRYSVEEAKKMMIEGTVEVTGTVKIDQANTLENLFQAARTAMIDGRFVSAYTHCIEALAIKPDNPELVAIQGLVDLGKEKIFADVPSSAVNGMNRFFSGIRNWNVDFPAKRESLENVRKYIQAACKFQYEQLRDEISDLNVQKVNYSESEETRMKVAGVLQVIGGNVFTQARAENNLKDIQQRRAHNERVDSKISKVHARMSKVQNFERANMRKIDSELQWVNQEERNYIAGRKAEYWEAHAAEKKELEDKINRIQQEKVPYVHALEEKCAALHKIRREMERIVVPLAEKDKELRDHIRDLEIKRAGLGIFKGKEKREITEQIKELTAQRPNSTEMMEQRKELQERMKPEMRNLECEISQVQSVIGNFEIQIRELKNELERER